MQQEDLPTPIAILKAEFIDLSRQMDALQCEHSNFDIQMAEFEKKLRKLDMPGSSDLDHPGHLKLTNF